jgi:hypothetical protein
MNTDERFDKLQGEVNSLRDEIKDLKGCTPKKEKKQKKVRDPDAPPRKPSEYNEHMRTFIAEAKAAATVKNEKFDHKGAFKNGAASWRAKKQESE